MKTAEFENKMKALSEEHESMANEFKEALMEAYINEGIIEVYSPEEFLKLGLDYYTPYDIARIIRQSRLELDCEYIYAPDNEEYSYYQEADSYAELYDAINGDDYIEELDEADLDSIFSEVTNAFKA